MCADSGCLCRCAAHARLKPPSWTAAVSLKHCSWGAADPAGIRPCSLGKGVEGGLASASSTAYLGRDHAQACTLGPSDPELVPRGRILKAPPASPGPSAAIQLARRHSAAGQPARSFSKQPGFMLRRHMLRRLWQRGSHFGCMSASQGLPAGLAGTAQTRHSSELPIG